MSGFGDALRHARANKGVTLTEAERAIRIPRKYLRALEDEDFAAMAAACGLAHARDRNAFVSKVMVFDKPADRARAMTEKA